MLAYRVQRLATPLLIAIAFFATGASWAVSSPPGSSPDDNFHLASIWCAWGEDAETCHDLRRSDGAALVPENVVSSSCYGFKPPDGGACIYELQPDFVDARVNSGSYPGLFYIVQRVFVGQNVAASVVQIRLFNVLLAALLIFAAVLLAEPILGRAVALSWLATLVPLSIFNIASTNPSSWVVIGLGTYWAFLFRFLTGPGGRGTWVAGGLAGVTAAMTAGARADGAAFLILVSVAAGLVAITKRRQLLSVRVLLPVGVAALGGYVFVSAGQSSALGGLPGVPGVAPRYGWSLLADNIYNFPNLLGGVFGQTWGLGWLDTPMPPLVQAVGPAVAFSLVVLASTAFWTRKALAFGLLLLACLGIPIFILQRGGNVVGESVQPRYLLPLVIVTLGFALLARTDKPWQLRRPRMVLLAVAVGAANCYALHTNIRRYVTGLDVTGLNLNHNVEWWWGTSISPMVVWGGGSIACFALMAALGQMALGPEGLPSYNQSVTSTPNRAFNNDGTSQPSGATAGALTSSRLTNGNP